MQAGVAPTAHLWSYSGCKEHYGLQGPPSSPRRRVRLGSSASWYRIRGGRAQEDICISRPLCPLRRGQWRGPAFRISKTELTTQGAAC